MCKQFRLKTFSGLASRKEFSAFELEAAAFAVDNNLQVGNNFVYGKSGETFNVVENSADCVELIRLAVDKNIRLRKVSKEAPATVPASTTTTTPAPAATTPTTVGSIPATTPVAPAAPAASGVDVAKLAAAIASVLPTAPATPAIDEATIKQLIEKYSISSADIQSMIKTATAGLVQRHNITINKGAEVHIDGVLHHAFNDVSFWANNRQPVYLFGPAATGKNMLASQVAKAMKLNFYYCGCLQNKYELEGFVNAAGEYQETEFYKAFTQGGVFLFDEIDGTAAEVLIAFNAALANGYYNFPKLGRITANENFVVLAAGNTAGRGASDAYNGRYQLDASTLDRFVFIKMDYDEKIELANAGGNKQIVEFAHTLRNAIEKQNLTYTVSPRAIRRLAICTSADGAKLDYKTALLQCVCGGWSKDDIRLLSENIQDGKNNTFINNFKALASC